MKLMLKNKIKEVLKQSYGLRRILHLYLQERFYIYTYHIRLFLKNLLGVIVTGLWLFGKISQLKCSET